MTDDLVRQAIIQKSIADYNATGHPVRAPISRTERAIHVALAALTAGPVERHHCAIPRMLRTHGAGLAGCASLTQT
jgi:hypothetical protein